MSYLNPAAWNGISIVTLIIILGAVLVMALFRGWIIPGFLHREIMAQNARELAAKDRREEQLLEAVTKFANAAERTSVAGELQLAVTEAIRKIGEERTS